jgi:multidrug resistance efflux pump
MSVELKKAIRISNGNVLPNSELENKTRLRSEITQEIISRRASGPERYALLFFILTLMLILSAGMFINYPDIIESRVTLTAVNAPKEIIPHVTGRLVKLFVHNEATVRAGQQVGWIESIASHLSVLHLSGMIDTALAALRADDVVKCSRIFERNVDSLGELQESYQLFMASWQKFNDYLVNGFYARKEVYLKRDVQALKETKVQIAAELDLYGKDLDLANQSYAVNELLKNENVLSEEELRNSGSRAINKRLAIPQLNASLISNETQQRSLSKELDQLLHDTNIQKMQFLQALQTFRSTVDNWKRKFILQAAIGGKISFIASVQENQSLTAERILGFVNPSNTQYYAQAYLSQANFGKVDTGLKAQLRFDAYPFQEYGSLEGRVNYVSKVAYDSGFLVTIRLDSTLMTDSRQIIPYKNGLNAQAMIITKNMRLLQRLYYDVTKSLTLKH